MMSDDANNTAPSPRKMPRWLAQGTDATEDTPISQFEEDAKTGLNMPLRNKPCGDCAVVWGMYRGISNDLKKHSRELQEACAKNWWCHETPGMACRGNAENLGIVAWTERDETEREMLVDTP